MRWPRKKRPVPAPQPATESGVPLDLALQTIGQVLLDMDARLAKKPDDADMLNEACWARAMFRSDLDIALKDCDKALSTKRDAATLDSRGLVQLQRGDWAKAASDYGEAIGMRPNQASSLFGRGVARKRMGDTGGSKADIAAATLIDPKIAETYALYGVKP